MTRLGPVAFMLAALGGITAPARAHQAAPAPETTAAAVDSPCPGDPIQADRVITGSFASELQGSYVMVPFDVPPGTTAVRVKYCFDQPESPTSDAVSHTLDLGIYDRQRPGQLWGKGEFRGWGGSSHPDVTVSAEGFSSEKQYLERPRGHVPGKTTRGFRPGPIGSGTWAAELGLAAIAGRDLGDSDGQVAWRVEIDTSDDPAFADGPYAGAPYDERPARAGPGWYAGDMHVHAEHSSLGDATMSETFSFAFKPLDQGGAGLDFVTLSDYVTDSAWGEIGRYQARHPGRLIARSAEVITYRGHINNHVSQRYVDHRTGPVYERRPDGKLVERRPARPARQILDEVRAAGGFAQVNHPTNFPSDVPGFGLLCRGCPWDYSDEETDYAKVDAIEVATGPAGLQESGTLGPNPFTPLAVEFYEHALAAGHHVAAVGASDSHNAGRRNNPVTQSPIGQATTVVHASELSEDGLRCAVEQGRTYVKVWGNDRPDLRLEARVPGLAAGPAIFGDTVRGERVDFEARVLGADSSYTLLVVRNGSLWRTHAVAGADSLMRFSADGPGRYGLRLVRGSSLEGVSTPIWVQPPGTAGPGIAPRTCRTRPSGASAARRVALRLTASARLRVRGRRAGAVRCHAAAVSSQRCSVRAALKGRRRGATVAKGSARFDRRGRARVVLRLTRTGRRTLARRRSVGVVLHGLARDRAGRIVGRARLARRLVR
jgi:hypothetical protein